MEKKSRILYLLKFLYENSDEIHPVSSLEIMEYLESVGIKVHRTTINADVLLMVEAGIDVITIRSSPNKYFIGERQLELPELKMLVDVVSSSKFITPKKSEQLTQKIGKLTSKKLYEELRREIYTDRVIKPSNEQIYYTVDKIQEAIRTKKWMDFKYLEYNPDKKLVYRNRGYLYELSPFTTFWSDDRYYVVGYSRKHRKIATFRIDRMEKPEVTTEDAIPTPSDFDPAIYANQVFEMFDGECVNVDLKCTNDLMNVIVDKFGEQVETTTLGSTHFKATASVHISPRFFGWVFGFAGKINILGPDEVKQEYKETMCQILESL